MAEDKFGAEPLIYNKYYPSGRFDFLIKHVHNPQWDIAYGFSSPDCKQSLSITELQKATSTALRLWIAPLAEMSEQPFVNKFIYHEQEVDSTPDFFQDGSSFLKMKLKDSKPHLQIIFYCREAISFAMNTRTKQPIPDINLSHHKAQTDHISGTSFSMATLVHELGHAFGLLDTYPTELHDHIGQPVSIMAGISYTKSDAVKLAADDIKGIKWLYRYYHKKDTLKSNACFFPDYELVVRGAPACLPKHPLITALKMAHQHEQQGNFYFTNMHLQNAIRLTSYSLGDPGKINAQDDDGNTALHYAVKYAQASKRKHGVLIASIWVSNTPAYWAVVGRRLLDLPPCKDTGDARRKHDKECFEYPTSYCACIDLTIKNKRQETALDLADVEILAGFPAAEQRAD